MINFQWPFTNIRYIGKESNNLEDNLTGLEDHDYLEYTKDHEIVKSNEFTEWILSLKPKDVRVRKYLKGLYPKLSTGQNKERYLILRPRLLKF